MSQRKQRHNERSMALGTRKTPFMSCVLLGESCNKKPVFHPLKMRISILKSYLEPDIMGAQPRAQCVASGVRVQIFANLDSRTLKKPESL